MTREELQRAIVEPARKVGLTFEEGLVEDILDDVGSEPGNLPLLEFVLAMLWERRRGGGMHHAAYQAIGKVQGAIAQRADEVYGRLTPESQAAGRRALIKLVRPGEGTEDTRRRAVLQDLGAAAKPVIAELVQERLLATDRDVTGREVVGVTHEALIQRWDRLRRWVDEDREFLRTLEQIRGALRHWEENGKDPSLLLAPGRQLAEGADLLDKRGNELEAEIVQFVRASREGRTRRFPPQNKLADDWRASACSGGRARDRHARVRLSPTGRGVDATCRSSASGVAGRRSSKGIRRATSNGAD
jgi:hypothetical protein